MTILVFGSNGQVGHALAQSDGVVALDRAQADLCDPVACAAKIRQMRPTCVINAAAYTGVDQAEEEPELAKVINGEAPRAMAVACADIGIPFLHISTDYVFDGTGKKPWKPDDIARPIGAYGRSKLEGEKQVMAAGGIYAILRTSWVFSDHGVNFVKSMLRLSETRDTINVVSDQVGGPTAAADIAGALLSMGSQLLAGSGKAGVYHYCGGPETSWAGFAREIFLQAQIETEVRDIGSDQYPTPAARPKNSRLDCNALFAEFSIEQPDWRQSLAEVLVELA